jgi:hypothetical protein
MNEQANRAAVAIPALANGQLHFFITNISQSLDRVSAGSLTVEIYKIIGFPRYARDLKKKNLTDANIVLWT